MSGIPKTLGAWVVAVSIAVVTYLGCWGVGYAVNVAAASYGRESVVPPPGSWTLRAVYVTAALAAGWWVTRRGWARTARRPRIEAAFAAVTLITVCLISGTVAEVHRHNFLSALPPGQDHEAALRAGHQACDWLAAQRWGRPPGPEHLQQARDIMYYPPLARWQVANSTDRLLSYYLRHVDAEQPGPLTSTERVRVQYAELAWFELCPFQQFVHRPVGSGD